MIFNYRRQTLERALQALNDAQRSLEQSIQRLKAETAIARPFSNESVESRLPETTGELRLSLAEHAASLQIATANLMEALGRKHIFNIREPYVPLDRNNSEELVARFWTVLWPDYPYPRIGQLTSEQRYYISGPEGRQKHE